MLNCFLYYSLITTYDKNYSKKVTDRKKEKPNLATGIKTFPVKFSTDEEKDTLFPQRRLRRTEDFERADRQQKYQEYY